MRSQLRRAPARSRVMVAGAISAFLAGVADAQDIPGTIRIKVTEVPVEVVVIDSKGNPALGLSKDEFAVFEDGVRQETLHFSSETIAMTAPPPTLPERSLAALTSLEGPRYRTFLILLGRGKHGWYETIPSLIRFVREDLRPADLVAVMAYNRATDFTFDRDVIVRILERFKSENPDLEAKLQLAQSGLAALYGRRAYDEKTQARIDHIFDQFKIGHRQIAPGSVREVTAGAAADQQARTSTLQAEMAAERSKLHSGDSQSDPDRFERIELALRTDLKFQEFVERRVSTDQDVEHIYSAVEYLRFMGGEKHLLFLHDQGLVMPPVQRENYLAKIASDARVRIHAIQTGRVFLSSGYSASETSRGESDLLAYTRPFRGSLSDATALEETSRLASLTGGLAFEHRSVRDSLQSLAQTSQAAYLLSYRPSNESRDGAFRRVEVKMLRDGLTALSRRGYYARDVLQPYDRTQFMIYARTAAALQIPRSISDIPASLQIVNGQIAKDKATFQGILTIRPDREVFTTTNDRHVGRLAVTYFLMSSEGEVLQQTWRDVSMELRETTYQNAVERGFTLTENFEYPAQESNCWMKVVVYDPANDKLGALDEKVRVR